MGHHSDIEGSLRWVTPWRRECEVRTRYGEEAILHQGEPYVWIGFGYDNYQEEERDISIALFLHSRTARGYAMRLPKQMGVRSIPSTGDLAEEVAQLVKAIEETPTPEALGIARKLAEGGKWRVIKIRLPGRGGRENASAGCGHQVVTEKKYSFVSRYIC